MKGTLFVASFGILVAGLAAEGQRRAPAPAMPFRLVEATIAEVRAEWPRAD